MISIPQITATFFNLAQLRLSVVFKKIIVKYCSGSVRGEMEEICKSQRKIEVSPLLFILIYRNSKHILNLCLYFGFFHCERHQKLNHAQKQSYTVLLNGLFILFMSIHQS